MDLKGQGLHLLPGLWYFTFIPNVASLSWMNNVTSCPATLCIKWHMMGWRGNLICFANLTQTSKSRKLSVSNDASHLLKCQTSTSSTFRGYVSKEYGFQFSQRSFQCNPVLNKTAVSFLKTEWFLYVFFFVCLFICFKLNKIGCFGT